MVEVEADTLCDREKRMVGKLRMRRTRVVQGMLKQLLVRPQATAECAAIDESPFSS